MRVAILGAGVIGRCLAHALVARGDDVIAVRRTPQPAEPHLTWLAADLQHLEPHQLEGPLDAVVLCVAPSPGDSYDSTYPPGARAALALARHHDSTHLVSTSSTGVYGGRDGEVVTEASLRRGGPPSLLESEDVLLGADRPGTTVLRVAGLYGPGRDPRDRYREPSRLPNGGAHWVNLVHHHDVVGAILLALTWRGAARVLNVADGAPTLAKDICRHLAALDGRDADALHFPPTAPSARSNQRIDVTALRATGWRPRYPSFREGFAHGLE
ncbi:MAG: NAD(P)-binding domain-containing protein [Myxococcales bacterium]|nr:NAD(P)-binding domain-containing protein [Myxococcales bacterium]